jgi:hypothetical protein
MKITINENKSIVKFERQTAIMIVTLFCYFLEDRANTLTRLVLLIIIRSYQSRNSM